MTIIKLFKHTNLKTTFWATNWTENNLEKKYTHFDNTYLYSGIYHMTWPNCQAAYIDQTDKF